MRTSCYLEKKDGATVQGQHLGELFEVASVAKVFTSYWAINQLGPNYRFETRFHVTPVSEHLVDVHIEGAGDPFYAHQQFYAIIAELNKIKIQKIRNLTFDENFYFMHDARTDSAVEEFWDDARLGEVNTRYFLQMTLNQVRRANNATAQAKWKKVFYPANLHALRTKVKSLVDFDLPINIFMSVASVKQVKQADYVRSDSTKTYASNSLPLHKILKEINRSSNNRAAEIIFKTLGGAPRFQDFMEAELALDQDDVAFVNGSGFPDMNQVPKVYDKATCEAVIAVIVALDNEMEKSKMGLENVMAVSAPDIGEASTISGRYGNGPFQRSVIAKTGSVDPVVALAGALETQEGEIYFNFIHSATGKNSWKFMRPKIYEAMKVLLNKFGGAKPIDYEYELFSYVDSQIVFRELNSATPSQP
jgi:D-alanyl-D-alanine carboxypeptidase